MNLSAPTTLVFFISLVIAVVGALVALGVIPAFGLAAVWIVLIGYVVLAAGCLLKGV